MAAEFHQWDVPLGPVLEFAKVNIPSLASKYDRVSLQAGRLPRQALPFPLYRRPFDTAGTGKTRYLIHILI